MLETIVDSFDIWGTAQTQKSKGKKAGNDNISLHGINRLRELIFDLAVRGKLSQQILHEKASEKLLIKINRKTEIDIPFLLPNNWLWCTFSDVAQLRHGHQFMKHDFVENGIPVIKIGQCKSDGTLDLSSCNYIDEDRQEEFKDYLINKGDLLMALTGGTLGKVTRVNKDYGIIVQNYRVGNFFTDGTILSLNYLNVILESNLFQNLVEDKVNQNAQPNIGKDNIEKIQLPIPPLPEQHRIVAKVDELMALCDKLEQEQMNRIETHLKLVQALLQTLTDAKNAEELNDAWQHLEPNFDILFTTEESVELLKQTVLQLAVMGKLVPQNPNDEPASVLLKKIAAEKQRLIKEGKLKKQKPLPEITDEEKPFELPEGWKWERLGYVTTYGITDKAEPVTVTPDTWILELEDIEKESSKLLQKLRVKEKDFQSSKNKFYNKDVVYGKLRPYLDKVIVADEPGICTTEMMPVRGYIDLLPEFLRFFMKTKYFIQYANESTHGMNLPRLGTEKARLALIPVLSISEQQRIVTKIDELMSLCDQLKERIIATQELKVKLADEVVEQAVKTKPGKVYEVSNNFDMAAEPGK